MRDGNSVACNRRGSGSMTAAIERNKMHKIRFCNCFSSQFNAWRNSIHCTWGRRPSGGRKLTQSVTVRPLDWVPQGHCASIEFGSPKQTKRLANSDPIMGPFRRTSVPIIWLAKNSARRSSQSIWSINSIEGNEVHLPKGSIPHTRQLPDRIRHEINCRFFVDLIELRFRSKTRFRRKSATSPTHDGIEALFVVSMCHLSEKENQVRNARCVKQTLFTHRRHHGAHLMVFGCAMPNLSELWTNAVHLIKRTGPEKCLFH